MDRRLNLYGIVFGMQEGRTIFPSLLLVLGAMLALTSSACSYHRAYIQYEDYQEEVVMRSGSWPGERLGEVRALEGGAIWSDCTEVVRGSLWLLIEQTQELGGNAIGDIRWFADCAPQPIEKPSCKRRWGWILLWPGLLTPAFMGAEVDAMAYRLPEKTEVTDGLFFLPENQAELEELVEELATGRRRRSLR